MGRNTALVELVDRALRDALSRLVVRVEFRLMRGNLLSDGRIDSVLWVEAACRQTTKACVYRKFRAIVYAPDYARYQR